MKKPWRKKPQQRREGFDGVGAAGPRVWQPGRLAYAPAAGAPTGGSGGASLRELARRRLWAEVLGSLGAPGAGVVLLVDDVTMRILSSLFRLSEVMEAGVHLVENLTMKGADGNYLRRQPLPDLPAVYLLTPSVESVNRFIDDFRADTPPAYRSAHLFFSSRLSDSLMGKLRKSNALPHVAALKEVAMELVMHESNVFVTPASTAAFHALFRGDSSPRTSHSKLQEAYRLATSLSTLFAALPDTAGGPGGGSDTGEGRFPMPLIRVGPGRVAAAVAAATQEKLDALAGGGTTGGGGKAGGNTGGGSSSAPGPDAPLLLVLDRTIDPLSPLLHEFTYQAMAYDLLPIQEDGKYRYSYLGNNKQMLSKEVLLSESDSLWRKYRHMHIADLTAAVDTDYKSFLSAHQSSAALNRGGADLRTMAAGMAGMPKFQEAVAKWSLHIALTSDLVTRYEQFNLESVALLEQSMACGSTAEGQPFSREAALSALESLLGSDTSSTLSPVDALRLIMTFVVAHGGITPDQRRRLLDIAGIGPEDQVAMLNLYHLHVSLVPGQNDRTRSVREEGGARAPLAPPDPFPSSSVPADADTGYDVSRYCPPLGRLAEQALAGTLDQERYSYLRPPHAATGGPSPAHGSNPFGGDDAGGEAPDGPPVRLASWAAMASGSGLGEADTAGGSRSGDYRSGSPHGRRRRLVVFVAGGVTYAEVRELLQLGDRLRVDVFVGATSILTPQRYLMELRGLQLLEAPNAPPARVQQRA